MGALMGYLEQHPELAALQRAKGGEGFVVDWAWTVERDEVSDAVGRAQDSLFRLAEEMCRGEALGLRVLPAVGAAVSSRPPPPIAQAPLSPIGVSGTQAVLLWSRGGDAGRHRSTSRRPTCRLHSTGAVRSLGRVVRGAGVGTGVTRSVC